MSALSFKQSFLPAPGGARGGGGVVAVFNVVLESIIRFEEKKKKRMFVMLRTKCHGLFDPIRVFSRFKRKKVSDGSWSSSSEFIPLPL